jgi:hypothetical protein
VELDRRLREEVPGELPLWPWIVGTWAFLLALWGVWAVWAYLT